MPQIECRVAVLESFRYVLYQEACEHSKVSVIQGKRQVQTYRLWYQDSQDYLTHLWNQWKLWSCKQR